LIEAGRSSQLDRAIEHCAPCATRHAGLDAKAPNGRGTPQRRALAGPRAGMQPRRCTGGAHLRAAQEMSAIDSQSSDRVPRSRGRSQRADPPGRARPQRRCRRRFIFVTRVERFFHVSASVRALGSNAPTWSDHMSNDPRELEKKFWDALKSDRTMMLGLDGVEDGHARPMTAQAENDAGPIWFFTAIDNAIVANLGRGNRAIATFTAKDHDLFASIKGNLSVDNDRATIDRLWNPVVAAWYEGKDEPKIALLRLDAEDAEIWLNGSSLLAGVKMLFGVDPKQDYQDKVAQVDLR
jgi:general stress protein 26